MLAPSVPLGEIVTLIGGGTPAKNKEDFYRGDIPWATVRDMKNELLSETEFCITEAAVKGSSTKIIKAGSVVTATRVGLGKVCILQQDTAINQDLKALVPTNSRLDKHYLFWWLKSVAHKIEAAGTGATVKGVRIPFIKALQIPLPPQEEQKRIVALLDQAFTDINKARALTEQNLKNARELFESSLQQVFSQRGEGWIEAPLGQMCSFKHGFAFKSEYFSDSAELILLTPGNFYEEGGYRDRGNKQKFYDGPYPEEFLLSQGDLLVAMTEQAAGLLGAPALVPENGVFLHNQRLGLVGLSDEFQSSVDLHFLFHLFNTGEFRANVQKTASGVKVRHTSPKKMQEISVSIPTSVAEQQNIAGMLFTLRDDCNRLEEKYRKKAKQLDELKKSLLQKAFSGELTQNQAEAAA